MEPWEAWHMDKDGVRLHGWRKGQGGRLLICLPGYGNETAALQSLTESLGAGWQVLVLNLPPLGGAWPADSALPPDLLAQAWQAIHARSPVREWHLLGYSLGARLCLHAGTHPAGTLRSVTLISPQGLPENGFFRFCTRSLPGRFLFRSTLTFPAPLLLSLRLLNYLGLFSKARHRMVVKALIGSFERDTLYRLWTLQGRLPVPAPQDLHTAGRDWHVIWGEQDGLLSPRRLRETAARIPGVRLYPLTGGHALLRNPALAASLDHIWKSYEDCTEPPH